YWMSRLANSEVNFKIVPEETLYVIGSNSKNTNGEFYSIDMKLALAYATNRRQKRVFDVLSSLVLILFSPLLLLLVKRPAGLLRNCLRVLGGSRTWIGYAPGQEESGLPVLSQGVITPAGAADLDRLGISAEMLNFRYAKDFSINNELQLLLSH